MANDQPRRGGRRALFLILLILLLVAAYKYGERGPDFKNWFSPLTPTPTVTSTPTATPTDAATETPTDTPTATSTPTTVPKPVTRKTAVRRAKPTATPIPAKPRPVATPSGPKPICTVAVTDSVQSEIEPNDVFYEAQVLGGLGMGGQTTVVGSLSAVGVNVGSLTGDTGHLDPKNRMPDLDRDIYEFSADEPGFRAILDCYTSVAGPPNPATDDNDFQLELYDENFILVGSSIKEDPVEHVECTAPGNTFYAVVYGFSGNPGKYRLTLIK